MHARGDRKENNREKEKIEKNQKRKEEKTQKRENAERTKRERRKNKENKVVCLYETCIAVMTSRCTPVALVHPYAAPSRASLHTGMSHEFMRPTDPPLVLAPLRNIHEHNKLLNNPRLYKVVQSEQLPARADGTICNQKTIGSVLQLCISKPVKFRLYVVWV